MKQAIAALAICASAPLTFGDNAELAQTLSNPFADLISLPFRSNIDFGIGPAFPIPTCCPDRGLRFGCTFLFPKS